LKTLRLGTRRSALALAQSRTVARALEALHDGVTVELVAIETKGDRTPGSLAPLGGKGLFTEELERGLLSGDLDLAVHSLKDLPVTLPDGLVVAAFPERADPRDVLVSDLIGDGGGGLESLPEGSTILTGALRRQAQVLILNPALRVEGVRGSVQTRIARWRERRERGESAGVILARSGLDRLGPPEIDPGLPMHDLDPEDFVPAPGQGTLAVEVKAGSEAEALCRPLQHAGTARASDAERRVVAAFGGNCALPLAAWARPAGEVGGALRLTALLATPDGRRVARAEATAHTPEEVAGAVIAALRDGGADEILRRIDDALAASAASAASAAAKP
jgi:hydroxymethylbilane synthase